MWSEKVDIKSGELLSVFHLFQAWWCLHWVSDVILSVTVYLKLCWRFEIYLNFILVDLYGCCLIQDTKSSWSIILWKQPLTEKRIEYTCTHAHMQHSAHSQVWEWCENSFFFSSGASFKVSQVRKSLPHSVLYFSLTAMCLSGGILSLPPPFVSAAEFGWGTAMWDVFCLLYYLMYRIKCDVIIKLIQHYWTWSDRDIVFFFLFFF